MFDQIKERARVEMARQRGLTTRDPNSTEAKKLARTGGIACLVLGVILAGINFATWYFSGSVFIYLIAVNAVLPAFGVWALVTGKFPGKK